MLTLIPATGGAATTLLANVGTSPLYFNGGSRTFISTPAQAALGNFNAADLELNGQFAIVAGGLFVNNGKVTDSSAAGNAAIIADYGALVKGAGQYDNPVITRNGGKFQSGNSPGVATFGRFVFGPGGVDNYVFAIDDATGQAGPRPNALGQVSGWGLVSAQKYSRPAGTTTGDFAWTADPSDPLTVALDTLVNPTRLGHRRARPDGRLRPDASRTRGWPSTGPALTPARPTPPHWTRRPAFDTSGFANPVAGTFGWNLDAAGQTLSMVYTPAAVPEPGTLALLGVAGAAAGWWCRRMFVRPTVKATADRCCLTRP